MALSRITAHQNGLTQEKAGMNFLLEFSGDGAFKDSYQLSLLGHLPYLQMFFLTAFPSILVTVFLFRPLIQQFKDLVIKNRVA